MGAGWILRGAAVFAAMVVTAAFQASAADFAWLQSVRALVMACADAVYQPFETHVVGQAREVLAANGRELGASPHGPEAAFLLFILFLGLGDVSSPPAPGARVIRVAWSALAALPSGFLVGTFAMSDPRLPWAVLAAVAFWGAGIQASQRGAGLSALPVMLIGVLLAFMAAGVVPVHFSMLPHTPDAGIEGTGLILAALSLVLVGLGTIGHPQMPQGLRAWVCDPAARAGLSVLAVLGGSMAVQYL